MHDSIRVAEQVVTLLDSGAFTATYKQAVLVALIDLCIANTDDKGAPPISVTTRQLAERVIELYWPQTMPWGEEDRGVLAQNNAGAPGTGRALIVRHIFEFRQEVDDATPGSTSLDQGKHRAPKRWERLVRNVEWTLIEMPLPKLQRVGSQNTEWLYTINWDDGANKPSRRDVRAYQRGETSDFDNQIRLKEGVGDAFVRLAGILRPFVLQQWASKVAALNSLRLEQLSSFLFGADRVALGRVRRPLVQLQSGRCFYCGEPLGRQADVDHFVPWARRPDNSLHNLVAAHPACNNAKRDFLAAQRHIERWRERSARHADELVAISEELRWPQGGPQTLGIARGVYLGLPADSRLWVRRKDFEVLDGRRVLEVLRT